MKKIFMQITALLLIAIGAKAQETKEFDFQLRIPLHLQYQGVVTNGLGSFGLAAWTIFTDVTARDNETATLHLLGPLWKYDAKGSWLEIMGGLKRNENGYDDPVIDLRFLDKSIRGVNLSGELGYFPRENHHRLYTFIASDTPISLGKYQVRLGLESENIFSHSGGKDSLGIGPRLVLPISLQKVLPGLLSTCTVAYQYRNDQDFLRCYLGLTYVFGGKK